MRVMGVCGWSGSGKTTLIARLIPCLVAQGVRVSTIKHAHHGFDIDRPGKDSHTHRLAGASEVLVSSGLRWALMHELRQDAEPTLDELLEHLTPVDLVIVEGFKRSRLGKLEVHRPSLGRALLAGEDPGILAIASDATPATDPGIPVLPLDGIAGIAAFMLERAARYPG